MEKKRKNYDRKWNIDGEERRKWESKMGKRENMRGEVREKGPLF